MITNQLVLGIKEKLNDSLRIVKIGDCGSTKKIYIVAIRIILFYFKEI